MHNADLVYRRKNGVYLYHEILSITKSQTLDEKRQKEILRDLAYEYAQKRAPNNIIFGTLHDDHEGHLHYHFCISSNAVGESRKTRMSKAEFDQFKKGIEKRALEDYPELEQKALINKQANVQTGEKLSHKGAELKRRTGKTAQRDAVKQKLADIFAKTDSKQAFFTAMSEAGFETYVRGKTIGVLDTAHDRKHRLKTLGLLDAFNAMSERIKLDEASSHQHEQAEAYEKKSSAKHAEQQNDSADKAANMEREEKSHKQAQTEPPVTEKKAEHTSNDAQNTSAGEKENRAAHKTEREQAADQPAQSTEEAIDEAQAKRQAEIERFREQQQQSQDNQQDNQQHKGRKQWLRELALWVKYNVSRVLASQLNKILSYKPWWWKQKTSSHSRSN